MSKLTKSNEYAIQWLHQQGTSAEDISVDLELPLTQVKRYVKTKLPPPEPKVEAQAETPKESQTVKKTSKDFMITKTSAKGNNSVAIMTKEASEMNDDARRKFSANNTNKPGIFRPLDK